MPPSKKSTADDQLLLPKLQYLYDTYRSALMNQKYYGYCLDFYLKWNMRLDIALAVGTSGAVGSWVVWRVGIGPEIWAVLGGLAAILAIVKPILRFADQIQRYSRLWTGLSDFYYDLEGLVRQVRTSHTYTAEMEKALGAAEDRLRKLVSLYDPTRSSSLLQHCYDEVVREVTGENLWLPPQTGELLDKQGEKET